MKKCPLCGFRHNPRIMCPGTDMEELARKAPEGEE